MARLFWILAALLFLKVTDVEGGTIRIVNGEDAEPGAHPHQVSLQWSFMGYWFHICGGSVIADNVVLTAAHCVDGGMPSEFRVVVNDHLLDTVDEDEQVIAVSRIEMNHGWYPNVDYYYQVYPHDIAVLFLTDDVIDKDTIIPMATSDFPDFAGVSCTISGWGLNDTDGVIPNTLQEVNMTVLTGEECSVHWAPANIFQGQICIFGGSDNVTGAAACSGDSGGPLVCDGVLAGVTSWGRTGCRIPETGEFMPSVYTRVSYYHGWVTTLLGREGPGRG